MSPHIACVWDISTGISAHLFNCSLAWGWRNRRDNYKHGLCTKMIVCHVSPVFPAVTRRIFCCCWQYMYATCYINHLVSWHQITIKCVIAGEIKHNIAQLNTETAGISHFWNSLKWCASPTPAAPSLPICLPLPTPGSGSQVEIYQGHTRIALQYSYHFNDRHCWEGKIATGRGRTSLGGGYPAVQSADEFEYTDVKTIFMGTITAWNSKPGMLGG